MTYALGTLSRSRLIRVHPKLVAVVELAITKTTQDFMVLEGVRSWEQMCVNYGKGRTKAECAAHGVPVLYAKPELSKVTWLNNPFNSKHAVQADGFGHAVDLVPYPVDWNDLSKFDAVAKAMLAAAGELDTDIRWGADWDKDGKPRERGETDSPHFELGNQKGDT